MSDDSWGLMNKFTFAVVVIVSPLPSEADCGYLSWTFPRSQYLDPTGESHNMSVAGLANWGKSTAGSGGMDARLPWRGICPTGRHGRGRLLAMGPQSEGAHGCVGGPRAASLICVPTNSQQGGKGPDGEALRFDMGRWDGSAPPAFRGSACIEMGRPAFVAPHGP